MIECIAVVMLCLWRSFTRPEPVALLHMAGEQAGTAKCGGHSSAWCYTSTIISQEKLRLAGGGDRRKKKPEASYDPRQSESSKNWTTNYGKHLDFIAILTSITYHLISHHHHPITQTGPSAHLFVLEVMGFDGTAVDPMLPLIPVTELIMSLLLKIAFHGGNFTGWKIWSHFKSLGIENPRGGLEDFQLIEGFMF